MWDLLCEKEMVVFIVFLFDEVCKFVGVLVIGAIIVQFW